MSKSLDTGKLVAGVRKDFRKAADEIKTADIENAVKMIHERHERAGGLVEETTKRTTLDIPKSLHKKISQRVLDRELSLKDYFLELARRDLGIQ